MLKYLSTTLISNYGDCPRRALSSHFKRQIHGDDNEGTDATRFGTVVHTVMEQVHHIAMTLGQESITDEQIMEWYQEAWKTSTCTNFELYTLGFNGIVQFAKKSLKNRHGTTVAVELEFVYDIQADEVFVTVEGMPNADRNYYAQLVRDRGHVPVVSKIDRIDRVSDVEYEVYDYKTNILPFSREQIETSKQLGIYDLVVRKLYPEAEKVWLVFDMFRHGKFPVDFDDDFRVTLRAFLTNLWYQMHDVKDNPEPKINQYCRWCDIRLTCPAYKAALELDVASILTENTDTPEGFNAFYEEGQKLANIIKLAEERRKEINAAIISKIEKDGMGEGIKVGEREFYLQANPRYSYKADKVLALLTEHKAASLFPQLVNVSGPSMKAVLKTRPELLDLIDEEIKEKSYVSPTPKARKLNAGKLKKEEGQDVEST